MNSRNKKLMELVNFIETADDFEINTILDAAQHWYSQRYPNYEVVFLSLPRNNPDKRAQVLHQAAEILMRQ